MRYMATIYVSDVMDLVASTLELHGWPEQYGPPELVCQTTVVQPGIGETDPARWLSRALIALAEDVARTASEGMETARPDGGAHIISGSGDIRI